MRILIATGGAAHSRRAVTFGGLLARDLRAYPTILTVIKTEHEHDQAQRILTDARAQISQYVPASEVRIRTGHPAEEIIAEAETDAYDLLVVGDRQHHTLTTRFLVGATAERVIEHAPCPVVVATGKIAPVRRVLLCSGVRTDNTITERALAQLAPALQLATTVTVLHVMSQVSSDPVKTGDALSMAAEQLIERADREGRMLTNDRSHLEAAGIEPALKVRHGLVVEEILNEARAGDYDLIVVGAHEGAGWRRILLDDLTHQILVGADRPVLVVR